MKHYQKLRRAVVWLMVAVPLVLTAKVSSPSGNIKVGFEDGRGITVDYSGHGNRQRVLTLGFDVEGTPAIGAQTEVRYDMLIGKRRECSNSFIPIEWNLTDGSVLLIRLYNDGIAWKVNGKSRIDVGGATHRWLQRWTDCYEEFFPRDRVVTAGERWAYPALFEYPGDVFALLTESAIDGDCAASSLYTDSVGERFVIDSDGEGEHGWQTLIVGALSDVVESTLVTDNSTPCRLDDISWISPGVASWVYWAYNHGSNDYDIIRKYIDFAAELSLPYTLIDAEWDEMKDGRTVEDAIAYSCSKGVRPMIWYNSSVGWIDGAPGPKFRLNNPADREKEFAWCERMDVAGVKIDFFSGDTNLNLKYMVELLEAAASHKLLVNFHGATLPRGWQRTYPNLITTEAVYGAEWYNNVPTFTDKAASHNATLPFTRNVVGSMDYTPCAFSDSQHPHITTKGHELALTVLFESGIQHIADRPESILAQPAEVGDFLSKLPTAWDDTALLSGYPGEYAVMARRKGDAWYISGINGGDASREIALDLSRLRLHGAPESMKIYTDDAEMPDGWKIASLDSVPESISLEPRGGFVLVVR